MPARSVAGMSLDHLASTLEGALVLPGSADFDTARLYHGRTGEPAAVVRVAGVTDVVAALAAARAEGLPVAVRGGGHSNWESLPGALVVDLGDLRRVEVDGGPPAADGARLVHVDGLRPGVRSPTNSAGTASRSAPATPARWASAD